MKKIKHPHGNIRSFLLKFVKNSIQRLTRFLVNFICKLDDNDELIQFADTLEKVCVRTVERGSMTKDLALLMPHEQDWHSTEDFLEIIERNLNKALNPTYQ